jgi:hypothetical protein
MKRMQGTLSKKELIAALASLQDDDPVFIADALGAKPIGCISRAQISQHGWFTPRGGSQAVVIVARGDESTIGSRTLVESVALQQPCHPGVEQLC